ncbi:putative polyketide synthase [Xylariomycetidae sp. FL0641]|nr:putative polyketide synthase [Xylariomycetidae sp. FL0641]
MVSRPDPLEEEVVSSPNGGTATPTSSSYMPTMSTMPIAIVGMACRFPGDATSPEKLWDLLASSRSAWSPIDSSRFRNEAWYHPDPSQVGTSYVKGAHFLKEDVALFDAPFFNFTADVASTMDPEVRLQLETAYEALENAGIPMERVAGSNTGAFIGTSFRDMHDNHFRDPNTFSDSSTLTGNGAAMVANRVSHFYDLRGPSIMVDTGCSTSLILFHLACQSLRVGECKVALVGGSGILLNPDMFVAGTKLGIFSKEGKSYSFDDRAEGYGRGDGIATVVLKPLDAAMRDGDPIRAVIRNTAVNQDGKTTTITSPSKDAQVDLMRACYREAGLDPIDTSYVEAHGTGTQTGDVIEANAVGTVFGEKRQSENPVVIGSVKTNIGHTEAVSGMAAIIKVVKLLEEGMIPPQINYKTPNPKIALHELKLKIPTELQSWPVAGLKRASVNNFGYGGANAHAILEHPGHLLPNFNEPETAKDASTPPQRPRVLVWSAKDKSTVEAMRTRLHEYLAESKTKNPTKLLDNLSYTLAERRSRFPWSMACSADSVEHLVSLLDESKPETQPSLVPRRAPTKLRLGFVFTGQGAQWYAMGRELIEAYPAFRGTLLRAEKCLYELGATWSLLEELTRDQSTSRVNEVAFSLPLSVVIQLALVDLLTSWGIHASGVTGHSSGEVAAAYAAGAIDLKSALAIVYCRGDLADSNNRQVRRPGSMIAVGLSREEAQGKIARVDSASGELTVACVNSPSSVTVSGDLAAVLDLEKLLGEENIFARRLKVNAAYHSSHMQPLAQPYGHLLARWVKPKDTGTSSCPVVYSSPTTGQRMDNIEEIASPDHWVRNMVQPVEFVDSLRNLCIDGGNASSTDMLLEVGPHGALGGPIRQTLMLPELKDLGISYASCLTRGESAVRTMHALACNLYQQGYHVNMDAVNFPLPLGHPASLQVLSDLPPYPWNHRTRYWKEARISKGSRERSVAPHDLLGRPTGDFSPLTPTWRHIIRPRDIPWVRDHVIHSSIIYPAAGYITMAIEAIRQVSSSLANITITGYKLEAIDIVSALILEDDTKGVDVRVSLKPCADRVMQGWNNFHIQSVNPSSGNWVLHCEGRIAVETRGSSTFSWLGDTGRQITTHDEEREGEGGISEQVDAVEVYDLFASTGLKYGPMFRNQVSTRKRDGRATSLIRVADTVSTMPFQYQQEHVIHPTTLDTFFQAAVHTLPDAGSFGHNAMVPTRIRAMHVSANISSEAGHLFKMFTQLDSAKAQGFESSATIIAAGDASCSHVLTIDGLNCQSVGGAASTEFNSDKLCFSIGWKPDFGLIAVNDLANTEQGHGASTEKASLIKEMVDIFFHKDPRANILEVGASKGECTRIVLEALESLRVQYPFHGHFDVTDPEATNLDAIRTAVGSNVRACYQTFDANGNGDDAVGIEQDSYGLIIVSPHVFTEPKIGQALLRLRSLLKEGGKLLVWDSTPSGNTDLLVECLQQTGFGDVSARSDIVMATAKNMREATLSPPLALVYSGQQPSTPWLKELTQAIAQTGTHERIDICALENIDRLPEETFIVFIGELMAPLLDQPSTEQFEKLKVMLTQYRGVMWVSRGAQANSPNPYVSLHHGLLRTLRCEDNTRPYISLDLDPSVSPWDPSTVAHISRVLFTAIAASADSSTLSDTEYAVRSGVIQVPRIRGDFSQNNNVAIGVSRQKPEMRPFGQDREHLRLATTDNGGLQSLTFVADPDMEGPLPDHCVDIDPRAYGLNSRDLMVALGQINDHRFAFDCSGIITTVGAQAAAEGFRVGDRVFTLTVNDFSTTIRAPTNALCRLPDWMDFETGASLGMGYAVSYHGLYEIAHLQAGETILIHSGTGDVGQSAIMMAQNLGAEIFVTADSVEKRQFINKTYGISEDHIFSNSDTSFVGEIMESTGGKGVDVVLNSLTGPLLRATWRCIAMFGRFVEIGKQDIELDSSISMAPFARCVSFASVDLLALKDHRPAQFYGILQKVSALVNDKKVGALTPITTFPISEIEQGFRTMQEGKHMGKVVIQAKKGDLVKVLPASRLVSLPSEGSYLIVGGLGGIGKSVAQFLAQRGARHLLIVSRSAASPSPENEQVIKDLQSQGVSVVLESCDITDKAAVAKVLSDYAVSSPPIRGVIQSAMLLRDAIFKQMSHADYTAALKVKVQGTWNLHELIPNDALDFFVMLSSISGLGGNAGQANYAAGGSFQDALARHRASQGLPGVSIDLGMVNSVGVLAEAKSAAAVKHLTRTGLRALEEGEVLRLIESAIRQPRRDAHASQVVTGIPPTFVRSTSSAFWNRDIRFLPLERADEGTTAAAANGSGATPGSVAHTQGLLTAVKTTAEAKNTVKQVLVAKLALEFSRPEADIDPALALTEIGVDSLIAVELRNWIVTAMDANCSIFDIMQSPSLAVLVDKLVGKSRLLRLDGESSEEGQAGQSETSDVFKEAQTVVEVKEVKAVEVSAGGGGYARIMRAGDAFVAASQKSPQQQFQKIREHRRARAVVINEPYLALFEGLASADLGYIMYTPGSTGDHKGIMNEHGSLVTNVVVGRRRCFRDVTRLRVLHFIPPTSDTSVKELFTTLALGGVLWIPSEKDRLTDCIAAMNRFNINVTIFTPSACRVFTPADTGMPSLQIRGTGGEGMKR